MGHELRLRKGNEVVLRYRPAAAPGVVTDVLITGAEPQYRVRFGDVAQIYRARRLELAQCANPIPNRRCSISVRGFASERGSPLMLDPMAHVG